jgi:ribosomal-protein-alanine N-acetyltransferase
VSVGRVGPEDARRLADLHAQAFDRPWSEAEIADLLRGAGVIAFAAAGGFILVRTVGGEAEVLTLAVAPASRRRGLGRALVDGAVAGAGASGAEAIFLEVAADNAAALALYNAAGFERVGLRRGYYPRVEGLAVDALTLRRALPSPTP